MFARFKVLTQCGLALSLLAAVAAAWAGEPGQHEAREGDEIVAAGQFFHTGTRVVLWMDPGGYDAYRVQRRFVPMAQAGWGASRDHLGSPNRYGLRDAHLTPAQLERVRGGGWDLPLLQSTIDQFVLHFDVEGLSRACFQTLQDKAGLSVHFMIDLDGTVYQTLDVKEDAWHATSSNNRSVGVEIANVGAYPDGAKDPFGEWYKTNAGGAVMLSIPAAFGKHPVRTAGFAGKPARREIITGPIHGKTERQHDFTPQQYAALARLTATLCTVFPKITCDYPREADGKLMAHRLPDAELQNYAGVLGHYHIQTDKVDPGPALQWDYIIDEARRLMKLPPVKNAAGEAVGAPVPLLIDN
jgi:N-acetylmuramoyl-L-alanine amidase